MIRLSPYPVELTDATEFFLETESLNTEVGLVNKLEDCELFSLLFDTSLTGAGCATLSPNIGGGSSKSVYFFFVSSTPNLFVTFLAGEESEIIVGFVSASFSYFFSFFGLFLE